MAQESQIEKKNIQTNTSKRHQSLLFIVEIIIESLFRLKQELIYIYIYIYIKYHCQQ